MLGSQDSQPIPLEQLKAQRDKAWEECCRLDWLICKEQNRLSDECRKQRDAWLDQREVGVNFRVDMTHSQALPKTYTG
ncbi:hypothetical protein [Delftia acidovorans]|uniref:hypothetical protein n=1 Tax=Delftia acidovorans TaxID=80866 RepID=UPI0005C1C6A1|nr:hypothetical protein [Delftia acidovorans]QPS76050.1 hypothetical protein I6G48_05705 [Delftia acidovorans]